MSSSTISSTDTAFPGSGDPEIALLRRIIDQIDARLIGALLSRQNTSHRVIAHKRDEGIPAVDLAREREIIAKYREELGPLGVDIAHAILKHSKGF